MVSFGREPAALPRREIALLISGDKYKLNIWLQGVKETLAGRQAEQHNGCGAADSVVRSAAVLLNDFQQGV